jgi:hypothetical protein
MGIIIHGKLPGVYYLFVKEIAQIYQGNFLRKSKNKATYSKNNKPSKKKEKIEAD